MPKQKSKQGINLLSGQDSTGVQSTHEEQAELAATPREYISYLKPNLTIAVVDDFTKYPAKAIPQPVSSAMRSLQSTKSINQFTFSVCGTHQGSRQTRTEN